MLIPMPMPISICLYRHLQVAVSLDFVSFVWKKRVSSRDEKFVRFSILFDAISGLLTRFPITARQTLLAIYMFKGNNKNIRTSCKTCLMLKLKNKCTETTLSNGVLLSLLFSLNVFFT